MASQSGAIYALDPRPAARTGRSRRQAGVRTAISVGPLAARSTAPPPGLAMPCTSPTPQARAYAVDAATGQRSSGSRKIDDHPAARATGAPTLYAGRLYVPLSGVVGGIGRGDARLRVLQISRQLDRARRNDGRGRLEDLHRRRAAAARQELDRQAALGTGGRADLERADDRREARADLRRHRQRLRRPRTETSDAIVAFSISTPARSAGSIRSCPTFGSWAAHPAGRLARGPRIGQREAGDNPNCPRTSAPISTSRLRRRS